MRVLSIATGANTRLSRTDVAQEFATVDGEAIGLCVEERIEQSPIPKRRGGSSGINESRSTPYARFHRTSLELRPHEHTARCRACAEHRFCRTNT
jgi:hypothetical protein